MQHGARPPSPAESAGPEPRSSLPRLPVRLADRSLLLNRLDGGFPLTVLRAPVGYGKTTLLADWAGRRQGTDAESVHWIVGRSGTGAVWQQILQSFRHAGISGIQAPTIAPPPDVAASLVEQAVLHHQDDLVLIIDALDELEPAADRALLDLIRRYRHLRLVVAMRSPERLPRHDRIDLDTLELSASDLAFSADETWSLAQALGRDLSEEIALGIHQDLAGWPAPTRAALLTLSETPVAARSVNAAQQAASDFLARQLPYRQFPGEPTVGTLALAVPQILTAAIVAALQVPAASASFDAAAAHGLLQPDDAADLHRLRWPAALRRLLLREMADQHPQLLRELRQRMAGYFADHDLPDDALHQALAAEDWAMVVSIIDGFWGMLFNGDRAQLRTALSQVPMALLRDHPRARVTKAMVFGLPDDDVLKLVGPVLRGSATTHDAIETDIAMMVATRLRGLWATAEKFADRVVRTAVEAQRTGVDRAAQRLPVRMLQVGITRLLVGDLVGSIPPMQMAYRESDASDQQYAGSDAASKLACALAVRGELSGAGHWLDEYAKRDGQLGWIAPLMRTTSLVAQVFVSTAKLDLAAAEQSVNELLTTPENQEFWGFRLSALIRFALANGSPEWGWRLLLDAQDRFGPSRAEGQLMPVAGGYAGMMLLADEANLLLAMQRATSARNLLRDAPDHYLLRPPRARLSLLSNDSATAIDWCNRGLADPATSGSQLTELLLIRALAQRRTGDTRSSIRDLRQAASTIRADGNLLALCTVPRSELSELAAELPSAEALLQSREFDGCQDHYPDSVDIVELTEREALLLQLLDEDVSLQAISRRLFVSVNTLKTQRRTLYSKLGASSRLEALIRAREWGLLEVANRPTG